MFLEISIDYSWTRRLIEEIKRRPPLYDKTVKEYVDRQSMSNLWREVTAIMCNRTWGSLNTHQKSLTVKQIKLRWGNIRTCFKRELNRQRQQSANPSLEKRRKYMYFDQLLFLISNDEDHDYFLE